MELVDAHCHLYVDPLGGDAPGVLSRARAAQVTTVVVPAYDLASWQAVRALAAHEGVFAMYGLHPWVADEPLDAENLARALGDPRVVGVGEIGLDYQVEGPDAATQLAALTRQLDLAIDLDLPVNLHCRGAFEDLLRLLGRYQPRLRGMVHAFSRGPDLARRFLDLGLMISFGGAITRPRAERARRCAQIMPLESILLETDAPSIGMEGLTAVEVEPCHTRAVAQALAELRGVSLEDVALATTANARRLFGIG
jgi:TatD DNase family protein